MEYDLRIETVCVDLLTHVHALREAAVARVLAALGPGGGHRCDWVESSSWGAPPTGVLRVDGRDVWELRWNLRGWTMRIDSAWLVEPETLAARE